MNESLKRHKGLQTMVLDFRQAKSNGGKELVRFLEGVAERFGKEVEIQGGLSRRAAEDGQNGVPRKSLV